ncbi:hypothetical protein PG988_015110 [Apiospora saccharicola]|uniref:Sulfotransferase domain-containing protein n=1 Tax=Apiospora marii TaxID=335849 RepID=A0ABR1SAX1_9PEZI
MPLARFNSLFPNVRHEKQPGERAIDALPKEAHVKRDMEVLGLGMSRTGTASTAAALSMLGYRSYHAHEIFQPSESNEWHVEVWREAFMAKMYGNGKPYGKEEFDIVLRNYSAVTDVPCICFADELIQAYPDAKVILTTRDPAKWIVSYENLILKLAESEEYGWVRAVGCIDHEFLGPYLDWVNMFLRYWTNGDWQNREKLIQAMLDHNDHIRKIVPKDNLLEWNPSDGWQPLCNFLGKPVPNVPFPHINKGAEDAPRHKKLAMQRIAILITRSLIRPILFVSLAASVWIGIRLSAKV